MRYSTFGTFIDQAGDRVPAVQANAVDESWEAVTQRLLHHQVTDDKATVNLFNGSTFIGSGRRGLATLLDTSMLILDFDNSVKQGHPDYEKGVKKMVRQPVEPYEVEALLSQFEFVIVTSHSHTPNWPRFRVVLPIAAPVLAAHWRPFVAQAMEQLYLTPWLDCIDDIYVNPSQPYYWPSCPPNGVKYAAHNKGAWLTFDPAQISTAGASSAQLAAGAAGKKKGVVPFTPEQVALFWAHELPDTPSNPYALRQTQDGSEWRCPCPIHGGNNPKFYVNPTTGMWHCKSKCDSPKGGDLYSYVQAKYNKTFPDAKLHVHAITGDPTLDSTPEELQEAIGDSTLSDVDTLINAIAKQPKKHQAPLMQQLITTHELDAEVVQSQVESHNKIVQFSKAGVEPIPDATEPNEYGLLIGRRSERYEIEQGMLYQMRWASNGPKGPTLERVQPPLTDRMIWPGAIGLDLATDSHYLQLCWSGSQGTPHMEWVPERTIRSRDGLLALDDAPISLESVGRVSSWLAYAKTTIASPMRSLATHSSWFGEQGSMRFVVPGDPEVQYIGGNMALRGSIDGWSVGLREILALGPSAYRALVVLGLSAAAPLVRHVRKRNPVLALIAPSSKGKNKVIYYGLSIWDEASKMRIPADSTVKGTQDKMKEAPDFPVFIDEVQQIVKGRERDTALESILYFAGEGQLRVTSNRLQQATGGMRRYGVSFMATEHDVFGGIQQGAQNRVVSLSGLPLPEGSEAQVLKIESSTDNNCGVVGRAIAALMNTDYLMYLAEIESTAWTLAEQRKLRGDDPYTIALMSAGLRILTEVTGITIPDQAVQDWLVRELAITRANAKDSADDVFYYLMEAVMGMPWNNSNVDVVEDADGGIAWRKTQATDPNKTPLEINPTHPKVRDLLRSKGIKDTVAQEWARKGWLHPNGPNTKRMRSSIGKTHSPGAWAWRITVDGLARLGLAGDFAVVPEDVQ